MGKSERQRVQGQSMQSVLLTKEPVVLAFAVLHVTDERTRQVLQVPPDLVQAPCDGHRFDQRVTPRDSEATIVRDGLDFGAAFDSFDGMIHRALLRRMTTRDRDVVLLDEPLGEGATENTRGLGVQRERDAAARAAIEPVCGVHVPRRDPAHHAQEIHRVVRLTAVNYHSRGLVDDDAVIVAIQHANVVGAHAIVGPLKHEESRVQRRADGVEGSTRGANFGINVFL